MTDEFGPLRQAMAELSEHGGSTDMYERALRKSRQSQRRIAVATTAAAAVVLAAGGTVAFAVVNRPHTAKPPALGTGPGYPDCPTTKTLGDLVELPQGWSFAPSGVKCVEDWAAVDVRPGSANIKTYLFHYVAGTGWKLRDQGDGWKCKDLGITEPAPFCSS